MTVINNVNHYTAEEVAQAIEEHLRATGRGAYRPDEIPGIARKALFDSAQTQNGRSGNERLRRV